MSEGAIRFWPVQASGKSDPVLHSRFTIPADGAHMDVQVSDLQEQIRILFREIQNFQEIAQNLKPSPGEVPSLPGIDIAGEIIPHAGLLGGDHIIYVDFRKRFDMESRILKAARQGRGKVAEALQKNKSLVGLLLADVSGHRITDALLTAMLHQAFLLGVMYELEVHGKVTTSLFENLNARFYQSSCVGKFLTMIYGEIQQDGTFSFISAAHPHPVVFSHAFDRIVDISEDRLVRFPPIGTMPNREHPDSRLMESPLGHKDLYRVNKINLMGSGDILLLYTDGLSDLVNGDGESFFDLRLEDVLRESKHLPAKEICARLKHEALGFGSLPDDLSFIVIRKE